MVPRPTDFFMHADKPATIAILGAGPIGLEAAIHARHLGYDVRVFERGRVGDNVRRWGHVRMFSPFSMNASPLGLAILAKSGLGWKSPRADDLLTGLEFVERYLEPLARCDLLADRVFTSTEVVAIGRVGFLKGEAIGGGDRASAPFELRIDRAGREEVVRADVVIDTTGTFANPNWLGAGGIPALGERAACKAIEYGLPDVLGADRERYAGRSVLVVGRGYSAATTVVVLAELAGKAAETRVIWVTRRRLAASEGPICRIAGDRLPERDALAVTANNVAAGASPAVKHFNGTEVESVALDSATHQFTVGLAGRHAATLQFDRLVANVGYRPDRDLYRELQIHECYATEGPMKLAQSLVGGSADCLDQRSFGPVSLSNPEPNFYILGAKSYGRNSHFLISVGLEQIRDVFAGLSR
jgi:thioredoxin reductase